jgi:hypothetical protein
VRGCESLRRGAGVLSMVLVVVLMGLGRDGLRRFLGGEAASRSGCLVAWSMAVIVIVCAFRGGVLLCFAG